MDPRADQAVPDASPSMRERLRGLWSGDGAAWDPDAGDRDQPPGAGDDQRRPRSVSGRCDRAVPPSLRRWTWGQAAIRRGSWKERPVRLPRRPAAALDLVTVNDGAAWMQEVVAPPCPRAPRVLDCAHAAG